MRMTAALVALPLAACATTTAGLTQSEVEETYASARAPGEVASCAAGRFRDRPEVQSDAGRYWLIRRNGYGVPAVRWDFLPDGEGTRIELRSSIPINSGAGDVRACL